MSEEHTHHPNYLTVWVLLVALLVVSVLGPMLGIKVVTLLTAFGVACVKAYLVARYFMHVGAAARYVSYLMVTCLVFMLLFFAGTAPDVMEADGSNWTKPGWQQLESAGDGSRDEAPGEGGH